MATKRSRKMLIHDVPGSTGPVAPPTSEPARVIPITATIASTGLFKVIKSNVKQAAMEVPLGACTAITSPRNRAGKTAVLDAFRLALTGKHPIVPHAADLAGLTPDGAYPWAKLVGNDTTTHYRFEPGKKTPEMTLTGELASYQQDSLTQLLPLVSMAELLHLGTAKAREALFKRFGGEAIRTATMPAELTEEQQALWTRAINAMGPSANVSAVDRLTLAGTWLRSHKKALGDRVRSLEAELQKLQEAQSTSGVGSPSEDLIRGVQEKLDAIKTYEKTFVMQQRMQESTDRLNGLIAQAQALPPAVSDEALAQGRANITAKWGTALLEADVASAQQNVTALKSGMQVYVLVTKLREMLHADGLCIVCTHADGDKAKTAQLLSDAERTVAEHQAGLAKVEARLAEALAALRNAVSHCDEELRVLQSAYDDDQRRRRQLGQDLQLAKGAYEHGQSLMQAAGANVQMPKETRAELEAQLAALNAAKAESGRATQLATDIRKVGIEVDDCKVVEKAVGDGLAKLVGLVKVDAEKAVNAWMPEGFTAALMLDDEEGKPACRWEIIGADGRPHPRGAMSGAEWSALTVAIACAWSEGQKHRFLLLDDADLAGFSAENVRKALSMVSKAVSEGRLTQALVAWSRPEEIPTEGWSVVQL